MRRLFVQILIIILFSVVGIFFALLGSIEAASEDVELAFLIMLSLSNGVWLIIYLLYSIFLKDKKLMIRTTILYLIIICPLIFINLHRSKFDSTKWKESLNEYKLYGNLKAHAHGEMVEDIVKSEILIGKSVSEVEQILGTHYDSYPSKEEELGTVEIYYFYDNPQFLSGCDKLFVIFKSDICIEAYKGGCD